LVWVNRQASFTSRVWARPSSALPGRPAVSAGVIGTPVPSTSMYSVPGSGRQGRNGITRRARIAADSASWAARAAAPSASAERSTRLTVKVTPASSASRAVALANGTAVAAWAAIERSPGDNDA